METGHVEKLKTEFIDVAGRHLQFTLDGDFKHANKLQKEFLKIYRRLHKLKRQDVFIELLDHKNEGVRLWSATALLKTNPEIAVLCLNELIRLPTITSTDAKMTLDLWKKGELELM